MAVPVIVKEIGGGISRDAVKKLYAVGVKVVDTAGWGGTNWAKIEGFCHSRARGKKSRLGEVFSRWGIPTADSIVQCREIKGLRVIGSGGIRNEVEVAKAIALRADLVGLALPFLEPATRSAKAVEAEIKRLIHELKIAMFCVGARNIGELKRVRLIKNRRDDFQEGLALETK